MEVDLNYVEKKAPSIITPIVFTNWDAGQAVIITKSGNVNANDKNIVEITNGNN
jgi:PTS system D-glucosamine-specific IIC component